MFFASFQSQDDLVWAFRSAEPIRSSTLSKFPNNSWFQKTHNLVSLGFQADRSPCIVDHPACVLPAIDFYDEFCLQANKIDDVRLDDNLAPEFETAHLSASKASPFRKPGSRLNHFSSR